jgi:hypothetical protein
MPGSKQSKMGGSPAEKLALIGKLGQSTHVDTDGRVDGW